MIYLASQSPRRAELLNQIGIPFRAEPAHIDEQVMPSESAEAYVKRIAISKAEAIQKRHPSASVLGSDTAVILDDQILGKPHDPAHAIEMLLSLAGREHRVLTGVALRTDQTHYKLSESRVLLRDISRTEAHDYCLSGEPLDKAGGYAIQGRAAVFIARIEGSYSGIMGLPLFETAALLRQAGHY